ncbi:sulfate ABC transporter substrate-binding protein, partial [Acinetobacter baumannii]|nr:sulfate ABC transporter substrate-binding protein [Acinetobacter baumannii]
PLHQIIIDYWDDFSDVEDLSELKGILKILNKRGEAQGIEKHAAEEIWSAIETHRSQDGEDFVGEADIKDPEWNVLIE